MVLVACCLLLGCNLCQKIKILFDFPAVSPYIELEKGEVFICPVLQSICVVRLD